MDFFQLKFINIKSYEIYSKKQTCYFNIYFISLTKMYKHIILCLFFLLFISINSDDNLGEYNEKWSFTTPYDRAGNYCSSLILSKKRLNINVIVGFNRYNSFIFL